MTARARASAALRGLKVLAGRSPDRDRASATCVQCGQHDATVVYRLGRRSARFWCRRCGAVATADVTGIRLDEDHDVVAAPVAPPDRLAELLATPVHAWASATAKKPLLADALDKAAYYQLHTRFDRAVEQALTTGRVPDALAGADLDVLRGLPSVSAIVGLLHENCYHADLVAVKLAGPDVDAQRLAAVLARTRHARRWLAGNRELCWVVSRHAPDGNPSAEAVAEAAARVMAGELEREDTQVLRAALFGTDGGPGLRQLAAAFDVAEIEAAVAAYVATGDRPLRDRTLAALDAPA